MRQKDQSQPHEPVGTSIEHVCGDHVGSLFVPWVHGWFISLIIVRSTRFLLFGFDQNRLQFPGPRLVGDHPKYAVQGFYFEFTGFHIYDLTLGPPIAPVPLFLCVITLAQIRPIPLIRVLGYLQDLG